MHAAAELFFRQQSEPALDQVEPAGRGGREMQMEARSFHQPVTNQLGFMGAVVVQDQMHVQFRGHVLLDGIEEVAELQRAMPPLCLPDQLAALGVEGGKQGGGSVARIIVRAAFDLAGTHGQQRSGSVQCLNLALFIDAQHQGAFWRSHIQSHNVTNLFNEQRVLR